jgi:hypothetical protein
MAAFCSLSDYRRIVSALPRPSPEQVNDFVEFVSDAHSWYKHLPLMPPGVPFHFFLNPVSGYDTVRRPDGGVGYEERTETTLRFHYTWMTTRQYRERFGHLDYAANAGMSFLVSSSNSVREYAHLPRFSTPEACYHLPPEVAAVGEVELTGVIHPMAPRVWVWTEQLAQSVRDFPTDQPRRWPAETGGDATLHQILEVCGWDGASARPGSPAYDAVENELKTLHQPEKERLQAKMRKAIHGMLDLVYQPDER